MEGNLKTMDTQQQNLENTRIKTREVHCATCQKVLTEKYTEPERKEVTILGRERTFFDPGGVIEQVLWLGRCKECYGELSNEMEKQRKINILQREIGHIGGPKPYYEFRFEKFTPRNNSQERALKICQEFDPKKENLLLIGPTGIGKTHLACAICLKFTDYQRYRVTELLRELRYQRTAEEEDKIIRNFIGASILLIEDLGAQKETDWGTAILWEIIDRRIERNQNGLIITSNHGRGKLSQNMGDKIPSRLSSICKIVNIEGDDYRVKNP